MSDSLLKRNVEIALSRAEPFDLAGSRVNPAALEIEQAGGTITLEPRVMQVLVALYRSNGEPLSRDVLIDLCWGGRVVTEGALNRCVAQVRKALSSNPRVRVETIPKVGYRLRTPGDAPAPAASRDWKVPVAGVSAVTIAALAIWYFAVPRPVSWTASDFRPLTTESGLETDPAVSPSSGQIVYTGRPNAFVPADLFLRNLEQPTPIQLTFDSADDYGAAWAPTGNQIAFTRSVVGTPCSLLIVPIPRGPERLVTRCQTATRTRSSWLDQRTLVFSDAPRAGGLPRIRTVDVETGEAHDLTSPPASTRGDADPVVSPDGRYVAFRRTLVHGADDLFALDIKTRRERALAQDGWKTTGYVWSSDSRHVLFSSNRGGEFGLWSVDLRIDGLPRQVSVGLGALSFSRISLDRSNRLVLEMGRGQTNLARVSLAGSIEPITSGTGSDRDAAIAADGTIAYISARSGSSQVWIARLGSEPVRVTSMRASYVTTPAWVPDSKSIAFVAVRGRSAEIYTVARDGSQLRQITQDGVEKRDPVYSTSGDRIFYVSRAAGVWRLMQVGLAPGSQAQAVPGAEGWKALRSDRAGHLYGQRDMAILALDTSAPIVAVGLTELDVWAVGPQGLYVRRGRTPERPSTIWFHPWSGAARKLADIPLASSSIAVDRDGAVIYSQSDEPQVDLGLMELHGDS